MSERIDFLKDMINLIISTDDAFAPIFDRKTDVFKIIRAEMDTIPLLSDKYEKVRSEFDRLEYDVSGDDVSKDIFLKFLSNAVSILETTMRDSDYYNEYCKNNDCWEPIYPKRLISNRIISLDDEYDKFFDKIRKGESFALMRSADGEYALVTGKKVTAQEGWKSPEHVSDLGRAIIDSFKLDYDNVYYAISCPCCDPSGYFWYLNQIKNTKNITFSNIWVNHNYRRFIKDFESIEKDAVVIANHRGAGKRIGNLNILKYYSVEDDCVSFWENGAKELIEKIADENKSRKGLIYVVSAGPLANPIIAALYKRNPDNIYIDFGSSIDKYIHEKETRPYMNPDSYYGNKICWMPRPDRITKPDISVVMSLYKRPDLLVEQLEAIENQTIKPSEILLFQDKIENGVYFLELAEEIKKRFTNVRVCSENEGVWGRFEYAQNVAKGEYVCIFDDDTIPGKRWLENCYMHMQQREGIYVTIGICMQTDTDYPYRNYYRVGWAMPVQENIEVDFGGHSWFVKKEYLDRMLEDSDEFRLKYKYVGEDAYLSYNNLRKDNVRTVVPRHYDNNTDLWGSLPEKANEYGRDVNALSLLSGNLTKMNTAINELIDKGWDRMATRDRYEKKIERDVILRAQQLKK